MSDRDEVIKGLEALQKSMSEHQCYACSYEFIETVEEFGTNIIEDAIVLLKEQEARIEQLNRFVNGFSRDAIPIVRCKDCERRGTYDCPVYVGGDGMYSEPDDWFCADGELIQKEKEN